MARIIAGVELSEIEHRRVIAIIRKEFRKRWVWLFLLSTMAQTSLLFSLVSEPRYPAVAVVAVAVLVRVYMHALALDAYDKELRAQGHYEFVDKMKAEEDRLRTLRTLDSMARVAAYRPNRKRG